MAGPTPGVDQANSRFAQQVRKARQQCDALNARFEQPKGAIGSRWDKIKAEGSATRDAFAHCYNHFQSQL